MDVKSQLEELKAVASKVAIEIQYRNLKDPEFSFRGGYCKIMGKETIILDRKSPDWAQVESLIEAFQRLDLENIYLAPWMRERIESTQLERPE